MPFDCERPMSPDRFGPALIAAPGDKIGRAARVCNAPIQNHGRRSVPQVPARPGNRLTFGIALC